LGWDITKDDLQALGIGAAILGTGGGGDPYIGRLLAEDALASGPVRIVTPEELDPDGYVFASAAMGAPTCVIEKLPAGHEPIVSFQALERRLGQKATAVCPMEAGGINSMIPLLVGARLNLPVVDADGMGRAFPELYMQTFHIYGLKGTPATLANEWSDVVTFETYSDRQLESLARVVTIQMGGQAYLTHFPMRMSELAQSVVRGTLGFALGLGRTVMNARSHHQDPVTALLDKAQSPPYRGAAIAFKGRITDVWRRTTQGFAKGEATIRGSGPWTGSESHIRFQNENLEARVDGHRVASVPDLITVLDEETAIPITTEYLHYGQRVSVLVLGAPEVLVTPEALTVIGPESFGLEGPYQAPRFARIPPGSDHGRRSIPS
jgi:hypothetical protein